MHLNASLLSAACALLLLAHTSAKGQSYDPRTQSPMSLVAAPADAVAYNDARSQVRALLSQSKAAEAEPLAEQITRDYPRDGENWLLLGQVRRALQKYEEAAVAFERANTLLWSGGQNDALASAAITRMLAGDRRAALEHLRSYTRNNRNMDRMWIFGSPPFASLQADPEFLEIAGRPDTSGWSRDYGWRRDIVFLRDEALRMNAEYRGGGLPPDFERLHEALVRDVPRLSDEQIYVGMNRLLAVFRQGHTFVSAEKDSRLQYKGLPLQFWVFPEGIFVVSASPAHQNLVGSRLVSINDIPAEEALRRINETQSVDGDNEYIFQAMESLRNATYLAGLGVIERSDGAAVTVEAPDGTRRTLDVSTSQDSLPNRLLPLPGVPAPLFLRQPRQFHWHEALPEQKALYVQLNNLADEPDESLTQYGLRLRQVLADTAAENLIIDLRQNGGGSTQLYPELLRTIVAFSTLPDRKVYVLIGRRTYSAAGNFATELEQLAGAVFIGEPTSECCTLYASPGSFTLPYSRLEGRMATRRVSLSRKNHDFRRELSPHLPVQLTAADYFAGRDPLMDTVTRLIEREARNRSGGAEAVPPPH